MAHLQVDPDAPLLIKLGADAILYSHIGGGMVGMASGTVALLTKKGGRIHRWSGNVFFAAMLVMAGIGGVVAPFIPDRISSAAGFMTLYFLTTGWMTAKRRDPGIGKFEIAALVYVLAGTAGWLTLTWMASQTPEGTLDGSPKQAFFIFSLVSTIALLSDLKVMIRRGISGSARVARHVWRMCFGMFVASGSFFLGQAQVFPDSVRHSGVLPILALAPLAFLIFWMLRVRLSKKWRGSFVKKPPRGFTPAEQGA